MRSFYCPNLVRIGCNAAFLSRFQCLVTAVTKFGEPVGKVFNGGPTFTSNLNEMKVLFGDSPPILKVLRDQPNSPLQTSTNKLGDVYETLFSDKFDAHDALEDLKALRKILFTAPLQVPKETLVNHVKCTSPNNDFDQATFLERRQDTMQSYDGKLYSTDQGCKESLSTSMIQKMADAGLSYYTLQALYDEYGLNGLYGVLALAPTTNSTCRAKSVSPRLTANRRILSMILRHFQKS